MAHRQLRSFSTHISASKDTKTKLSTLKKYEYIKMAVRVGNGSITNKDYKRSYIAKQSSLSDRAIPINFKVLNNKFKIVII